VAAAADGRARAVLSQRDAAKSLTSPLDCYPDAVPFASFVALGDSFTEGIGDPYPDGSYQGWADRFARHLAATSPGLAYANIAIRGKLVAQVIDEQVPVAIGLAPDLVSIAAGGNDLLRPGADPDALAASFERGVAALRSAGSISPPTATAGSPCTPRR
jgi:lysophospholipase L1-like esterase